MNLHDALADPRRYRQQIERLHGKHLGSRRLYELRQSGISLASFVLNQDTVAGLIAKAVERGEYQVQPARVRAIRTDGKSRRVFSFRLTDLLVHGVVAGLIAEASAPHLSSSLYSYRKGVSWWSAISDLAAYIRTERDRRTDPRQGGLYVIRRDIDAYTDSIPVDPASPLWGMLGEILDDRHGPGPLSSSDWRLIEDVVRPAVMADDGGLYCSRRGVATGQPISCVLFNLYLSGLDHRLRRIPGAFYARYSDDLVFAHPAREAVDEAESLIDEALAALGLRLNAGKTRNVYLTAAGHPARDWPGATGATAIPFLGCLVSARGTVTLSRDKRRRLLDDLERRAHRTARLLAAEDRAVIGRAVCATINRALQPHLDFSQQRSATLLRRAVTDRDDLKQLDYCIARIVLRAVTGRKDVRGFREVGYRTLRRDWKLLSLVHARNTWRGMSPRATARSLQ